MVNNTLLYITLLGIALGLLCAAALWMVWLRDKRQVFARDISFWSLTTIMLTPSYALWLNKSDALLHWIGYVGMFGFYAAGHAFLLAAVRRFSVDKPLRNRTQLQIGLGLAALYSLLLLTPFAIKAIGAASSLVAMSAGIYCCVKLWKRSKMERTIGFLIMLAPLANVILVLGGDAAVPAASSYAVFSRLVLAFAFIFAALNRSAAHGERMLERFEHLSEHSMQGIIVQDTQNYYYLNPAVVAMFGYQSADEMMRAGPFARAVDEAGRARARKVIADAMAGSNTMREAEGLRVRPDGTQVYLRFSAWPVDWDGRRAVQILVSDDTEKRRAALELQHVEEESRRVEEEHRQALMHLNAELERKVIERTKDLAHSNDNLAEANVRMEHALETLRSTQAELVQREKLASLGRMVAGIAHELNTPIGNALTIGSSIRHQVHQLRNDVESGQLKKSTLTDFLAISANGADVLESSLHKAHALISNFRQVAKDHTDEPRSAFNLSALLAAMQVALQPGYENTSVALEFALAGDVQLQSYPGHIEQLVTQLIDNARQHAFTGMDGGTIRVTLALTPDGARISVSDNGRGIPSDVQGKVFDPFFTTRLGGNLGLGLNTVYTVATSKLGGSVQFSACQPQGARFDVLLPLTSPLPSPEGGSSTLH